jgi:hypothetical protein
MEEVCDRYFALTGLAPGAVTLAAKVELLSSLIDGQAVAVLLDDAQSVAQVLPFLSSLPGVIVLVTSRMPLPGLAQFRPRVLGLAPLPDAAVRELFDEIVGAERTGAEPEAFAQLVRMCAGLPLLASQAAGLLYDDTGLGLGELVRRMRDQGRLAALEAGHDGGMVSPSAVFEVMYRELGPLPHGFTVLLGCTPCAISIRDWSRRCSLSGLPTGRRGWNNSEGGGSSGSTGAAGT